MNIYVGNLSYDVTDSELQNTFAPYGKVISAKVISDSMNGRSRGFGFVEMESRDDAMNAINELNGKEVNGRALVVNEARPKNDSRPPRGGGRGGFGGGDRRGGEGGGRRFR